MSETQTTSQNTSQNQTQNSNKLASAVRELFMPLHNSYVLLTEETNRMLELLKNFVENESKLLQALGYEVKNKTCNKNSLLDVECTIDVIVPDDLYSITVEKHYYGDFDEYRYKLSLERHYVADPHKFLLLKYRMWKS